MKLVSIFALSLIVSTSSWAQSGFPMPDPCSGGIPFIPYQSSSSIVIEQQFPQAADRLKDGIEKIRKEYPEFGADLADLVNRINWYSLCDNGGWFPPFPIPPQPINPRPIPGGRILQAQQLPEPGPLPGDPGGINPDPGTGTPGGGGITKGPITSQYQEGIVGIDTVRFAKLKLDEQAELLAKELLMYKLGLQAPEDIVKKAARAIGRKGPAIQIQKHLDEINPHILLGSFEITVEIEAPRKAVFGYIDGDKISQIWGLTKNVSHKDDWEIHTFVIDSELRQSFVNDEDVVLFYYAHSLDQTYPVRSVRVYVNSIPRLEEQSQLPGEKYFDEVDGEIYLMDLLR